MKSDPKCGGRLTPLNVERHNGGAAMRTFQRFAIVAAAVMGLAASVPLLAQQSQSSDLLSNKQARELAMTAKTPAEHATLQKHFLALAAKYDAEAAEHVGLAEAYRKNIDVGRRLPGTIEYRAKHCDRLAGSLKEAAKDAREISAEHGKITAAPK
jgi:hypothetical protein